MRAVALLAVVMMSAPAAAQSYRIELRESPAPGKSVIVRQQSRQEVQRQVRDEDDNVLRVESTSVVEIDEHTLAVQKAQGGVPTHFTRDYFKAEVTIDKVKKARSYQARKVLFENKHGKLTATITGTPALDEVDRKSLEGPGLEPILGTIRPMLPTTEVSRGETWKIALDKLKPIFKGEMIQKDSRAVGKLVKVYEKDGRRYGMLDIEIDLAVRVATDRKQPPGRWIVKVRADAVIDGKGMQGTYRTELTITGRQTTVTDGRKISIGGTTRAGLTVEVGEEK